MKIQPPGSGSAWKWIAWVSVARGMSGAPSMCPCGTSEAASSARSLTYASAHRSLHGSVTAASAAVPPVPDTAAPASAPAASPPTSGRRSHSCCRPSWGDGSTRFSSTYRRSRNAHSSRQPSAGSVLRRSITSTSGGTWSGPATSGMGAACAKPSVSSWKTAVSRTISRCSWCARTARMSIDRPSRTRSTSKWAGPSVFPAERKRPCADTGGLLGSTVRHAAARACARVWPPKVLGRIVPGRGSPW